MTENFDNIPRINDEALLHLREDLGDEGLTETGILASLLKDFREDAPGLLQEIRDAYEAGKADLVQRGAHTLKSNGAMFGASRLAAMCRELEELGRLGLLDDAHERISEIDQELQEVMRELPFAS